MVELLSIEDGTGACSWVFRTPKFPFDGLLSAPGLWVKYTSVTSSMINVVRNYNTMSQNLEISVKFQGKKKNPGFFMREKKKGMNIPTSIHCLCFEFSWLCQQVLVLLFELLHPKISTTENIWNICTICRKKKKKYVFLFLGHELKRHLRKIRKFLK